MRALAFQQVDVFTAVPFKGNPVAVVLEGDALSTDEMQAIAAWTNLSETTFLCTPRETRADYRLRIFTTRRELPFAGHPTIGSAHAALRRGIRPRTPGRLVQECGKGLVDVAVDGKLLAFELPAPTFRDPSAAELAQVARAIGVAPGDLLRASIVDVGPVWFTLQLDSPDAVLALRPDMAGVAAATAMGVGGVNVFALARSGADADLEVRSFAPAEGVPEDPVCGSGNGCVAALVRRDAVLRTDRYVACQGRALGRDGRVTVRFAGDAIWVGGEAVTCIEGTLAV